MKTSIFETISFLNANQGAFSVIFSFIVMFATVVYARLTAKLVKETKLMRKSQTEPKIQITANPREEFVHIISLHVKNIGYGPAYDLNFELSAEGESVGGKKLIKDFSQTQFLEKGLSYLGPNQIIKTGFTQILDNTEEKLSSKLIIKVNYKNYEGDIYQQKINLNFEEFRGYGTLGKPNLYSIAQSLEQINKKLGDLVTGYKKLSVNIFSEDDRQKKIKADEDFMREIKNK